MHDLKRLDLPVTVAVRIYLKRSRRIGAERSFLTTPESTMVPADRGRLYVDFCDPLNLNVGELGRLGAAQPPTPAPKSTIAQMGKGAKAEGEGIEEK